eukprot:COSAG02_NODE_39636_length_414_cov_5.346032_1_plen_31_part_01
MMDMWRRLRTNVIFAMRSAKHTSFQHYCVTH